VQPLKRKLEKKQSELDTGEVYYSPQGRKRHMTNPLTTPEDRRTRAQVIFASPDNANNLEELQSLAMQLRDEDNNIEYARRVSEVARRLVAGKGIDARYEVLRMLAICTYKTPDQPWKDG
jgi:hypothetical protein